MRSHVTPLSLFSGHRDAVYGLAAGKEGEFFSVGGDGWLVRWKPGESSDGQLLARLPGAAYSLLSLPERKMLVAGLRDGSIYFLDTAEGKLLHRFDGGGDIFSLAVKGDSLVAGSAEGAVYAFCLEGFALKLKVIISEKSCRALSFSPEGPLASGWSDGQIRIFDADSLKLQYSFPGNQPSVFCLAWIGAGEMLLAGGRDAQLRSWWPDLLDYTPGEVIAAHLFTINDIVIHPSGRFFATGSRDKTIKLWDADSLEILKVISREKHASHGHTHSVNRLLWLDADTLVSAGDDRAIRLWRVEAED